MRKFAFIIFILFLISNCVQRQDKIEKIVEDGVDVVINHLEPYKLEGMKASLTLEQEMAIDTENDEIAKIGLVDMETFDIDEEGKIYIIRWASNENFVYKFDSKGKFVKSFVHRGQGPGEIE